MIGKAKEIVFLPYIDSQGKPCNQYGVTFIINESKNAIFDWFNRISKYDNLTIEAKKQVKKRSHDANAYYWVLVTKLASKLGNSMALQHNLQLRKYGQIECIDGRLVEVDIPDTDEAEKQALENAHFHIKPTSETFYKSDIRYRTYHMLRGSHTYTSEEMAYLIDNTVEECKIMGIETLSPEELERMYYLWTPSSK